jgi:hypothetical protein
MGIPLKVAFTVALCLVLAVVLLFVKRGDRGPRDAHWWRGGERDPVRRLLLRSDGQFRPGSKLGIAVFFLAFIVLLWAVVP